MKKLNFLLVFILLVVQGIFAQWNILDKQMGIFDIEPAWKINQAANAKGELTRNTDYVNFTKTLTGQSGFWAWVCPSIPFEALKPNMAYSVEVKARTKGETTNQISLRVGSENIFASIYLKYGNASEGYISTKSGGEDAYKLNTAEEQVYRFLLHADHKTFDVYVDGVNTPIFKNIAVGSKGDANGVYFGAESNHKCNIDVMYVKMGEGDLFSRANIASISLSRTTQTVNTQETVEVTVNTALMDDGAKLLCSLLNAKGETVVNTVEATVQSNVAKVSLIVPATLPVGVYTVQVKAKDNATIAAKTTSYEIKAADRLQWDVIGRVFSEKAWNAEPKWSLEKGKDVPESFVSQAGDYVRINKTQAAGSWNYGFLISPSVDVKVGVSYTYEVSARVLPIDKTQFPDIDKPSSSGQGGHEANQIAFQMNGLLMSIYLVYGTDENPGYVASHIKDGTGISPSIDNRFELNTSEFHAYRLVYNAYKERYDIYVDGKLVFSDIQLISKSGSNMAKLGGESWQRCNMEVAYVRLGTGDLVAGDKPLIATMNLSSDAHIGGNARTISVTAKTLNIDNGEKLMVSFTDEEGKAALFAPVEMTITDGQGAVELTIPETMDKGKYLVKLTPKSEDETLKSLSMQYVVTDVSPLDTKMLPQVKTVGFVKEIDDYKYYTAKKEFIFPSIVDTKKYTDANGNFKKGGGKPIARYYLFYAPHDNPGGIFLSTSNSLDGPWVEYGGPSSSSTEEGRVMTFDWAAKQNPVVDSGNEKHISGQHVVWNEDSEEFIMYFHGPNTHTHYATSDDMINWTFGKPIIVSHQFSAIGAEASYAKVFKHTIPGLDNKYVMLLMNQENQVRRIYWAHSKDGKEWTAVPKPLISPDLDYKKVPGTDRKPSYDGGGGPGPYGNNVSGPFLMERDGRYFVIAHGCADNLMVVEVGEAFDMEVHWGEYIKKEDNIMNGEPTRPAAPDFIQDDNGKWYMFFEAGGRLGANIGYAKEGYESSVPEVETQKVVSISRNVLNVGESLSVSILEADKLLSQAVLYNLTGKEVGCVSVNDRVSTFQVPKAPGMYILRVYTNDSHSKEFKILVK